MSRCIYCVLLLCYSLSLTAQDSSGYTIAEASRELAAGDYAHASEILDSLERKDGLSATAYLGLGNAYFEVGKTGRAILAYERGLRLRPGHRALRNNLKYVREEAGLTTPVLPEFFLLRWWRAVGAFLGSTVAYIVAACCWWIAVVGGVYWYLRRRTMAEKRRFVLLPLAVTFLVLAVVLYALGQSRYEYLNSTDEAVLLTAGAALRVSPTEAASVEDELPAGSHLSITDRVGKYVKVTLADGRQGYLLQDELAII
ncbi:hypothetical protein LEM8419_01100 [Neolewinella maritima]|uniref:Tetratricopeptide repeat protein n=1 Tax=Neolewinella maritima TaxID=1383882 RepID=A0ABM9AZP3_9BACT|nr:hypothetical protein [Neolewinella maritima]CAH0999800.1 hypothetical protein LEM8419_01100 [Neolewinella maritima]